MSGETMDSSNWILILIVLGILYLFFKNRKAKKAYLKKVSFIEDEVRELKKEIWKKDCSNIRKCKRNISINYYN